MTYLLLGPVRLFRADPYMSPEDTLRVRKRRYTMLFRAGTAIGAFYAFMLLYAAQFVRFDYSYVLVGLSIVFQLIGLALVSMQSRDLHTRNFSVYRPEGDAPVAR